MCHYAHLTTAGRKLSRVLKRSASSVSREFRRNSKADGTYSAHRTDKLYHTRKKLWQKAKAERAGITESYAGKIYAQVDARADFGTSKTGQKAVFRLLSHHFLNDRFRHFTPPA